MRLELGSWNFRLQADGMPGIKTVRRPIDCLPARRPFAFVPIVRRCVEPQPGNDGKGMALARVDGYPFTGSALALAAKLG